mgnify:CR=1 FL=1
MAKFRKKPTIVEAIQWKGNNLDEVIAFLGTKTYGEFAGSVLVETPKAILTVAVGNWIIKGADGEFHPCSPSDFEMTYEAIE